MPLSVYAINRRERIEYIATIWEVRFARFLVEVFFCWSRHCSRDSQIPSFSNFFLKIGSHDTIHTLKNYFAKDAVQIGRLRLQTRVFSFFIFIFKP